MYKKAFELSYKNKKVEIEIQDFVGDVRNINGAEDLFSLSYISDSKDKGQSILVTEADINFYADDYFNIDELKTVGETDIKVKYYEDDALLWSGFVIPDFFSTSVDTAPVVSMVATDRIGTLKEISNNAESNIPIQILASCLKQTGQDLPINLIADNNHFETPIQLERIEDIASYDVIRTFMVLFNCKITLYKNAWWIINKKLLESGFVNYKSYNFNGVGGSVTPFAQPILDIDLVDRDGQREIKPTASEISLFLEFGGSKKYPKNWNFEKWNGTTFDNWTNYNGFSQGKRQTEIIFYTRIDGYYQAYLSEIETENKSLWYVARWYSNKLSDNILDYPNLKSSSVNVPKERGFIDIALNGNFTTRDGMPIWIVPLIHNKTNGNYFTYNKEGVILKIGSGTPNFNQSNFDYVHNPRASSQNGFNPDDMTHASVDVNWDIKNTFDLRDFGSDSDEIEMQVVFLGGIYLQGSLDYGTDVFLNAVNISFNDSQVTGKGLIFKVKQGGEKFSKSRDPETILFSDKINQGVNGYFYNYKYDDTSIVDLPSEFALSSVRERADMFSKARDYYSLDGNFIVNPLAKYTCGLKSFVLVGGENRREDASIIVEEIVSNTLNRTDFIYTYFDDGKDKVKTIGTASGGSSSGGGGGSSPSVPQLIKEDENGNYYSEQPFYSLGGLSAFGFSEVGDGNGGGGIINVIDNLTSTSKTDPLSANMGRYLKTLIDNIEVGEGGQVIVDWEAITGKPSTFAPSAHTHIIGDVTGLQSALDGKASLAQLDDKEDKFTKNSAFNKNFGTGLNDVSRGNHTHTFASLTSKPTTLSGYEITDGANKVHTHAISDVTNLQTELDKKATNTALTTHINKTDNPHSVTKSQVGLGNVANKDLSNVDNIQQATKTEFTSHKNLFDSMFRKVGTNIEAKLSLYSLGGLSAYGFSEEGSETGGGIVNILPSWESYTSDKSGWALSAGLGKGLYDNKADKTDPRFTDARTPLAHTHIISDVTGLQSALNAKTNQTFSDGLNTRLTSIEGGSATTVNVSGTGDLLASVSKVGNNINFIKGNQSWNNLTGKPTTFAPSAHTHIIGDVTGLQGALDNKASLTQLNGKEDKFTKNSAFNKNFGTGLNDVSRGNHTHTFASLTSKPTTLAGYGITDGANKVHTHAISDVTNLQTELDKKATNTALTTHINKTDNPHSVTKSQVGLGNVANKDLSNVDNIQQATKTEFTSHKNLFDSMFRKVGTNIEAKLSLYSLGGLSAYGFSEEGSETGGGIVNILPSWANYTTDKSGWALSAGLGVDLNTRKADKTWVESLLEDYVPTDTTYTAGRGLTLTGTQFSTSFDIANYATVTALGGKVDKVAGKSLISDVEITRLAGVTNQTRASLNITNVDNTSDANKPISNATQTALNSKLATSIFNTHNNDNIRHITGAERTKWDGVVTDFGNLEIGGRNLLLKSDTSTSNSAYILKSYRWANSNDIVSGEKYTCTIIGELDPLHTGWMINVTHTHDGQTTYPVLAHIYNSYKKNDNTWVCTFIMPNLLSTVTILSLYSYPLGSGKVSTVNKIKLEKGNKATDWTPAPEDQVSDWNTTDVNSFSFIKNKPTMLSQFIDNIGVAQHRIDFDAFKTTFDTMFRKTTTNEIEAKLSLYTLGGLSAYGFSDEGSSGGGGGIVNILSDWAIYDASKEGWALGAGLGKGLYDNKADKTDPRFTDARTPLAHTHIISDVTGLQTALNAKTNQTFSDGLNQRLTSIEGGSATTVNVSGTGDLLASVSKVGNNINFIKGNQSWGNLSGKPSTFAPSAHSHPISDITNLQTTLNNKLETSIFNTHNTDNVRHITGVERTKWDGVVTDFAGLEIGGVNLMKGTADFNSKYWERASSAIEFDLDPSVKMVETVGDFATGVTTLMSIQGWNFTIGQDFVVSVWARTDIEDGSMIGLTAQTVNVQPQFVGSEWKLYKWYFKSTNDELQRFRFTTPAGKPVWIAKINVQHGNKIGSWSPAPEDQVSDWSTTDVNSFSFIKNKPTLLSQFTDNIGVATHIADKSNPHSVTKLQVGLGNVDNTSDLLKPISTATQTALDSKLNKLTFDDLFEKVETSAGKWAVKVKYNLFSVGEISAFGLEEEGGGSGGGSMNMMQAWSTSVETENYYLPAKLAVPFYDDTRSRLSTLEAGTAPASHTHPISDITNLQTTLNNKLETSVFNTHNNDNIRHITGAERTKWDGVVTDFGNLEIGGRNLFEWNKISYSDLWVLSNEPYELKSKSTTSSISTFFVSPFMEVGEQYTISFEIKASVSGITWVNSTLYLNSANVTTHNEPTLTPGKYVRVQKTLTWKGGGTGRMHIYISGLNTTTNYVLLRNIQIEKGTKATDWTPAPEDQVSDWNTTDVNSFSYIKNKPTLLSQFTDNIGVASHIANKSNPHSVTKAQIGLSNVDNAKQATKVEFDLFKSAFDEMFRKVGANIEAKLPLYSLGGLSAYGFSDEGSSSGGGIVNILPSWESYDTSKSGWALSAGLGENLRTRVVALENAEIDLSGYATLNYVNDKVKTNVPLNAKFTDTIVDISGKVDKKTGFSLISDTEITRLSNVTNQDLSSYAKTSDVNNLLGGKVDKVTGKSLISDTEITRLSSVTNQDLTPYALKTYVDTEVGKKWTYSEATIKAVKVSNAFNSDTVNGFTVGINVPSNAKFTDTIVDISGKVDKVTGKGLSTNDFTTAEKNKLATLENQTKVSLGLDNVTNESKLTMFANPTFTGTTKVTILELNTNWKFVKVGNNIELQYNGVTKQIMTNNGDIIATAGVTAYQ